MHKTLLIVGMDPGTTAAYALLDLDGNLIETYAERGLSSSEMIRHITDRGLPVIVGTDKKDAPGAVSRIATRFGARLIIPNHDLLIDEKSAMTSGIRLGTDHERDALASALYAHAQVKQMLSKTDRFIEENGKAHIAEKLKRLMLLETGLSLRSAAALLETSGAQEKEAVTELLQNRDMTRAYVKLMERHMTLKRELNLVRTQRDALKDEALHAQQNAAISPGLIDRKVAQRMRGKAFKHCGMLTQIRTLRQEILDERRLTARLRSLLMDSERYKAARKLDNLGSRELENVRLRKGEVLLVADASAVARNVPEQLRKVSAIIISERSSKSLSGIAVIDPKGLNITDLGVFAMVERSGLDHALDGRSMFARIVDEYRKKGG
jgi:uncharacterized protein